MRGEAPQAESGSLATRKRDAQTTFCEPEPLSPPEIDRVGRASAADPLCLEAEPRETPQQAEAIQAGLGISFLFHRVGLSSAHPMVTTA